MIEEDPGVDIARWLCVPTAGGAVATTASVVDFAGRHGMDDAPSRNLERAVSGVLAHAVTAPCRPAGDDIVVDAATDGDWLSVAVHGSAPRDADGAAEAAAGALADRLEWHVDRGARLAVLMEFSTGAGDVPRSEPCMPPASPSASTVGSGPRGC